jgi:putative hydrolase of the HAD superfamily
MLFSDEIGIRKPNKQIFQTAAEKSKTQPCSIVHVGDNLKCDVWGAKNAGFKAIHFSTDAGKDREAELLIESMQKKIYAVKGKSRKYSAS